MRPNMETLKKLMPGFKIPTSDNDSDEEDESEMTQNEKNKKNRHKILQSKDFSVIREVLFNPTAKLLKNFKDFHGLKDSAKTASLIRRNSIPANLSTSLLNIKKPIFSSFNVLSKVSKFNKRMMSKLKDKTPKEALNNSTHSVTDAQKIYDKGQVKLDQKKKKSTKKKKKKFIKKHKKKAKKRHHHPAKKTGHLIDNSVNTKDGFSRIPSNNNPKGNIGTKVNSAIKKSPVDIKSAQEELKKRILNGFGDDDLDENPKPVLNNNPSDGNAKNSNRKSDYPFKNKKPRKSIIQKADYPFNTKHALNGIIPRVHDLADPKGRLNNVDLNPKRRKVREIGDEAYFDNYDSKFTGPNNQKYNQKYSDYNNLSGDVNDKYKQKYRNKSGDMLDPHRNHLTSSNYLGPGDYSDSRYTDKEYKEKKMNELVLSDMQILKKRRLSRSMKDHSGAAVFHGGQKDAKYKRMLHLKNKLKNFVFLNSLMKSTKSIKIDEKDE